MAKRPIVSNKEIVDSVSLLVPAGVTTDIDILTTVNNYVGTVGTVPLGAMVLGFYIETSTSATATATTQVDWFLVKRNAALGFGNFPAPGATGGNVRRKFIFHESKGLAQGISATTGGQTNRMREFIKIPKGFRRCGDVDTWSIRVTSASVYNFCLKVIYKWYV